MNSFYRLAGSFLLLAVIPFAAFCQYGVPDATFGINGSSLVDISGFSDDITGVIMQPDGKIVMSG
ncbi:MAG: hypothetical protein WBB36_00865, partial [Chitinophagales bacterium]